MTNKRNNTKPEWKTSCVYNSMLNVSTKHIRQFLHGNVSLYAIQDVYRHPQKNRKGGDNQEVCSFVCIEKDEEEKL